MTPYTHANTEPDMTVRGRRPDDADDNTARDLAAGVDTPAPVATPAPIGSPALTHADVTVVRVAPSSVTVTEIVDASNFGKYQLDGELARGGMGVVYKARQKGLERHVALKMILGAEGDKEAKQRFFQEARAAAALDHPNVVPIYDIDEIGDKPYFTMALIEGPNLRGYIDTHGAPSVPALVSMFAQIVAGVAHAHKYGIVHRDLKPANVLIDKDGRPRVTDFGLAKRASADAQLTTTGQVVGTPAYMAPEQARDSKDVGPAADVYSLGAIMYFMLTGKAPFHADSVTDLLIKVVMEPPVPPRALRPDVPEDVEAVCLKCLAKAPADRFPDAQELLGALAPLADQYLPASANLTPSAAKIAFPKPRTAPSLGSVPFTNSVDSVPSLSTALPKSAPAPVAHVPAPPPAPKPPAAAPNRKPVVLALGAVAAVMLCVVAFLLTRDKAKPAAPVADSTPKPVEVVPAAADPFAWPAITRSDFGVRVDLSAPGATKGADGALRFVPGVPMQVRLKAARDCRVSVWWLDPNGQVLRLFPNDDESDDRLVANVERVVPGNDQYVLETTPTEGAGHERLRVIATTGSQPPFPPGAKSGRFTTYSGTQEREKVASTVRGIVIKKPGGSAPTEGAVSEAEILFRVQK
ncbi:MAG TPA: serine/threonine-protein kinase [Gemmata sp.]